MTSARQRIEAMQQTLKGLQKEKDLLKLYLYDSAGDRHPDGYENVGIFGAILYRATSGNGGYVLIKQYGGIGTPVLVYLDDINDNYPPEIKIIAERFRAKRQRLCEKDNER